MVSIPKINKIPRVKIPLPAISLPKVPSVPLPPFLYKICAIISCRTLGIGLGGVFLFCIVLLGYAAFSGPKTIQKIEESFETTIIPLPHEVDGHVDVIGGNEINGNLASLPPAPIRGLYEVVKDEVLPVKSINGVTPFHAYKRPVPNIYAPVIAIAIEDFGLSESLAEASVNELPADITFILSPYAKDADAWQKRARETGHEIWLSLPLENVKSSTQIDTGPYTLTTKVDADQNTQTAYALMGLTSGYAGLAVYSDGVLASRPQNLIAPLNDVLSRGVGVLELNTNNKTPLINYFASTKDTPYIQVSISTDDYVFETLELIAKSNGYAVTTIAPYPKTIEKMKNWAQTLEAKQLQLVPVSAIPAAMKKADASAHKAQKPQTVADEVVHHDEIDHSKQNEHNTGHHE